MNDLRRIEQTLDMILVELRVLNTFLRLGEVSIKSPSQATAPQERVSREVKLPPEAAQQALRR